MNNLPNSDRHIQIQRDAIGSAIVSGEGNKVFIYQYQYHVAQAETPNFDAASTSRKLAPNPYRGLLAFEESDGDRFFGREKQTEQLWKKLRELYEEVAAIRLLPVYGPSGSGKSSLVRAGLIPELARRPLPGRNQVRVAILVPGAHPLEALAGVLASIATNDLTPVAKTREFAGELSQTNKVGEYDGLRRIADVLPESHTAPLIVLIDQFEEVYTLCQDQTERDAFVGNLLYAVSDRSRRVSVVVTLRSDLLGETQKHPVLNRLFSSQGFLVPAMSEEELCEAIRKPAEFAEHPLDEATIQLLLEQAEGREGALPLLQFALTRMWEGIGEGGAPAVTLERIGGVGGALAGEAQRVFDSLSSKEQVIARRVFLGLVQLGEGTRDTRRRTVIDNLASYKDDDAQVRRVVERFSDPGVRLITLGSDENGQETVEVSHEALFNHWQLLDRWLEESRSALRFQRRLEEVVQNWEQRSRPRGNLWRSPDLDLLRRYVQQWGDSLTPAQLKFFQASVSAERQSKVLQWVAVSSLITLTGLALWQTWTARRGEQRSFAQQLAAQAESMNNRNAGLYQTSALLAVEAKNRLTQLGESSLEVDRVLRNVVLLLPRPLVKFSHDAEVVAASFSPDGSKVIAGSWDKTARIWDSVSEKELARLNHDAEVVAARFSPDGSKVITGSYDKTARIWDSAGGKELARLNHDERVEAVSFSPDSRKVITGSYDKTARIWDTSTGKELARLEHGEGVEVVNFNLNGSKVITGSRDKTARIWDMSTGKELIRFNHDDVVRAASFSPDGSKVITGSYDKTARIWDMSTGKELARLEHGQGVEVVSFSPDSRKVITGSYDKTAQIWPVSSKNLINEVCSRITRNLTAEEWISYLNSDVSQYGLVCKNLPVHPSVLIAGQNAVIQDDVARGIAIFNRAKLLQPDLDLDPTTLEIDRDPQKTARAVAASEKIERGSEYAKSGKVDEAIQLYQETQKTIDISADQWNSLCWFGSLHRRATDVMFACDKAVTLNPSSKWIRKSRGVAKALTGNVPVAIEDLQIFVNSLDPSAQAKASEKQWIEQLRSGQSPFTDDLLQNLLKE